MKKPILQVGDGYTPLDVDQELRNSRSVLDEKDRHIAHQKRLKIQQQSKKSRKKRK